MRNDLWSRAAMGWRSVCISRRRAEAGDLPSRLAALWAPEARRRRLVALVNAQFRCDVCGGLIDPDRPFGVRLVDGASPAPGAPAAALRPVCGDCRTAAKHLSTGINRPEQRST